MAKRPARGRQSSHDAEPPEEFEKPRRGRDISDEPGESSETLEFDSPSDEAIGADAVEGETLAIEAEIDEDIVALKHELDDMLAGNVRSVDQAMSVQDVDAGSNIVGVGFGAGDAQPETLAASANLSPGDPALVVFTIEAVPVDQVVGEIASVAGTRALTALPVIQVPVGIVDALPHRMRMRPAPGGISVAHFNVTAGTLGCLVRSPDPLATVD